MLSLLVLFLDLLRLGSYNFYAQRAVLMLSSLRALRIIVLSPAMQALLGALASSLRAVGGLSLLSESTQLPVLRPFPFGERTCSLCAFSG